MTRQTQCEAVLQALKAGPRTTMQLISLGICCPTRRIFELRKHYEIVTSERRVNGKRIVTYRLLGQAKLPLEGAA